MCEETFIQRFVSFIPKMPREQYDKYWPKKNKVVTLTGNNKQSKQAAILNPTLCRVMLDIY
jgi:hypothetical protein